MTGTMKKGTINKTYAANDGSRHIAFGIDDVSVQQR